MRFPKRANEEDDRPAYKRIKEHIEDEIRSGRLKDGDAIPPESALTVQFKVSRMTANRALRELTDEGFLVRVQGSGTFVAQQKYQSTLVVILSIAEEIMSRGHIHSCETIQVNKIEADSKLAAEFELKPGAGLFHSVLLHCENDVPVQVEDRFVNPAMAPDYLSLDFSKTTANEYLMQVAPLYGVNYVIDARIPPPDIAHKLHVNEQQPCLVLYRKTFSRKKVASVVTLWHPANRYQFRGGF
jgi:GntR family histidine utilization transcriptional repressor